MLTVDGLRSILTAAIGSEAGAYALFNNSAPATARHWAKKPIGVLTW